MSYVVTAVAVPCSWSRGDSCGSTRGFHEKTLSGGSTCWKRRCGWRTGGGRRLSRSGVDGLDAHAGRAQPGDLGDLVCFAGRGPGEVFSSGRKVVGLSQWRSREGSLFSSCAYAVWDPAPTVRLLDVDEPGRARLVRELGSVAVGLSDLDATPVGPLLGRLRDDLLSTFVSWPDHGFGFGHRAGPGDRVHARVPVMARVVEVVRAVSRITMVQAVPVVLVDQEDLEETADNLTAVAGFRRSAIRHRHRRHGVCRAGGGGHRRPVKRVHDSVCRPVVCDLPPGRAFGRPRGSPHRGR